MRDKVEKNRQTSGENILQCVLTDVQVLEIRKQYKEGRTQIAIASDFGVQQCQISRIVNYVRRRIPTNKRSGLVGTELAKHLICFYDQGHGIHCFLC